MTEEEEAMRVAAAVVLYVCCRRIHCVLALQEEREGEEGGRVGWCVCVCGWGGGGKRELELKTRKLYLTRIVRFKFSQTLVRESEKGR